MRAALRALKTQHSERTRLTGAYNTSSREPASGAKSSLLLAGTSLVSGEAQALVFATRRDG
jgi:hypothetical protein